MSKFEFIMMFVSVVVAFSLAELMMGWGRLIRSWQHVQRPVFVLGWSFWLLVVVTFHYLGFWEYQTGVDLRSVGQMLLGLSAPIVLVLLSFVLTPELREGQSMDLEEHYFRIKDWFFPLVLVFFVLSALADSLLPDFRETWFTARAGHVVDPRIGHAHEPHQTKIALRDPTHLLRLWPANDRLVPIQRSWLRPATGSELVDQTL